MNIYYDTGLLLKLYTLEPQSPKVREFIRSHNQKIPLLSIHQSECASALHLKAFRKECTRAQANRALSDIAEDQRMGFLTLLSANWDKIWSKTIELSQAYTATIGCRTLDTLHVAAALEFGFREFASSDTRQKTLAEQTGMIVHDPTSTN
ncbi:MAG: type II toxin-antitoxin system VapC family toxin [Verrucomicrobiota bacterium]